MGVSGQHHAPAALYPRGKEPRYPLYRRLAYADDVNILGENIDTIQRNTEASICDSKEVGLEVNPDNTKAILL
jgi:hypothetical protein